MIINLKSKTELSGFYIVYKGSTNIEKKGWRGLSHLMEHLMCKNFDHLQEDFDRDGISYNAYTSSNEIVFYIKGLEEKVNKWRDVFMKLMSEFNVTKEDFLKERKIVIEEYKDSFNSQLQSHILNLNRKLFDNFAPIGSKKDLEELTFMDCLNFFELQYSKPTKIINVSKNSDYENEIIDFNEIKDIKELSYNENNNTELEEMNDYKDKTSIVFLSKPIKEDFAYIDFINSMLCSGLTSPLYKEIRENRGLAYFISPMVFYNDKSAINSIMTVTSVGNFEDVKDGVKKILTNPDKYLTENRLEITKESFKVKKKKEEILRHSNVRDIIDPEEFSVYNILDDVNMTKVREVFDKYYNFDDLYISNDKDEFKQ